jgi:hypothetical protein
MRILPHFRDDLVLDDRVGTVQVGLMVMVVIFAEISGERCSTSPTTAT